MNDSGQLAAGGCHDGSSLQKMFNVPWRGGVALFDCLGDLVSPPVEASVGEVPMMTTMMYYIGGEKRVIDVCGVRRRWQKVTVAGGDMMCGGVGKSQMRSEEDGTQKDRLKRMTEWKRRGAKIAPSWVGRRYRDKRAKCEKEVSRQRQQLRYCSAPLNWKRHKLEWRSFLMIDCDVSGKGGRVVVDRLYGRQRSRSRKKKKY